MADDFIRRVDASKALYADYAYAAMDVIKRVPAADVAEVVHGEWAKDNERSALHVEAIYLCSACRNYEAWGETEKTPYCPHCGARMDGWMEDADNG